MNLCGTFFACLCLSLLLSACSGGAVVFAPTPAPPDASPLRYSHPSGAFSLEVPRQWAAYEQYTTALASASFAPPDDDTPLLTVSVVDLGQAIDAGAFGDVINRYQSQARPDIETYTEQNREALGDGSWRIGGLRLSPSGETEQVNTFIERDGSQLAIIEILVPDDPALAGALEQAINTVEIAPSETLQPTDLSTLAYAKPNSLNFLHVATWTTPDGVFFITGEVSNSGTETVTNLPIEADLLTSDGLSAGGAVADVMGHGIPPGGFAPFSVRFGQGQPSVATNYVLRLGGEGWQNSPDAMIHSADSLAWTDESRFDDISRLVISGEIENVGDQPVRNLRAIITVFDGAQRVIGAAWADVTPQLLAGETVAYTVTVPELGGDPINYIVNVQGTD
jgi:hypothetical protein